MLHFAYGSNMIVPMMRRMCPAARCEGRAVLPGYRVFIIQEGYASIRRAPASGSCVHGVLWRLTSRDLAALNAYENLAGGLYRAAMMSVIAAKAYTDQVESRALPGCFTSPRGGEVGSRLRDPGEGNRPHNMRRSPLTRNARAQRAHSDLSPTGRGEERVLQAHRHLRPPDLRRV
jgi:hypothetical protein